MTNKKLAKKILATLDELVFDMFSEPLFDRGHVDDDDEPEYPGLVNGAYDKAMLKIIELLNKVKKD